MPVLIPEGSDTADLNSVFTKAEWGYEERVMLDVQFPSLAQALGTADGPGESIAVPTLLAIAYVFGWSGKMLDVNPVDYAGELEAVIDAHSGVTDTGDAADANLATAQAAASN